MEGDKVLGVVKGVLWCITTYWFAYISAIILWNVYKSNWMILMNFNGSGEAIIEIPIFLISAIWITIAGTKEIERYISEHTQIEVYMDKYLD